VSFPSAVDEHERARCERQHRAAQRPDLPRIDSEKTLAASDDEHENVNPLRKLAKYRSRDSGVSSSSTRSEKHMCKDEKVECKPECSEESSPEDEEPAPRLSKTRKILLGMVTMLNVLIAVSTP
jgi:hypothetical protein